MLKFNKVSMHWELKKLSPQCRNVNWQDDLYQSVSTGHV